MGKLNGSHKKTHSTTGGKYPRFDNAAFNGLVYFAAVCETKL